jgi:hypothetical protein
MYHRSWGHTNGGSLIDAVTGEGRLSDIVCQIGGVNSDWRVMPLRGDDVHCTFASLQITIYLSASILTLFDRIPTYTKKESLPNCQSLEIVNEMRFLVLFLDIV